jgi:hypothetical protein
MLIFKFEIKLFWRLKLRTEFSVWFLCGTIPLVSKLLIIVLNTLAIHSCPHFQFVWMLGSNAFGWPLKAQPKFQNVILRC